MTSVAALPFSAWPTGRKVAGKVNLMPVEDLGIPVLHAFDAPKTWTFA